VCVCVCADARCCLERTEQGSPVEIGELRILIQDHRLVALDLRGQVGKVVLEIMGGQRVHNLADERDSGLVDSPVGVAERADRVVGVVHRVVLDRGTESVAPAIVRKSGVRGGG
jgi:hypothetical protein